MAPSAPTDVAPAPGSEADSEADLANAQLRTALPPLILLVGGVVILAGMAFLPVPPAGAVVVAAAGALLLGWPVRMGLALGALRWIPHALAALALLPLVLTTRGGCSIGCGLYQATWHDLPISAMGMGAHALFAIVAFSYRRAEFDTWPQYLTAAFAFAGVGVSLGFLTGSFLVGTWCNWCLLTHAAMFVQAVGLAIWWSHATIERRLGSVASTVAGFLLAALLLSPGTSAANGRPSDSQELLAYLRMGLVNAAPSTGGASAFRPTTEALAWGSPSAPTTVLAVLQVGCHDCASTWQTLRTTLEPSVTSGQVAVRVLVLPGASEGGDVAADLLLAAGLAGSAEYAQALDAALKPQHTVTEQRLALASLTAAPLTKILQAQASAVKDLRQDLLTFVTARGLQRVPAVFLYRGGAIPDDLTALTLPLTRAAIDAAIHPPSRSSP